jgi:hypothetical protein
MDQATLLKYVAGAALLGSVYALVWFGMMDPAQYRDLVIGALSALGINAIGGNRQ